MVDTIPIKVSSKLAFTVDYANEFGGELGKRIFRYYKVYINGHSSLRYSIQKEYSRDYYTVEAGSGWLDNAKSRKEAYRLIREDIDKNGLEYFIAQTMERS